VLAAADLLRGRAERAPRRRACGLLERGRARPGVQTPHGDERGRVAPRARRRDL